MGRKQWKNGETRVRVKNLIYLPRLFIHRWSHRQGVKPPVKIKYHQRSTEIPEDLQ